MNPYFNRLLGTLFHDIAQIIQGEVENFVFQIAIYSKTRIPDLVLQKQIGNYNMMPIGPEYDIEDPNYRYAYPTLALAKDKKFVKVLNEIKRKFDYGSKDLLYFSWNSLG